MEEAIARCDGNPIVRPARMRRYRQVAAELRAILRRYIPEIEHSAFEGAYFDVPPSPDPVTAAAEICVRIQAGLGVQASAGIGRSRFVAHMAARYPGSSMTQDKWP